MTDKVSERDAFQGVIGRTVQESQPWWPPSPMKPGAPNVVVVVLDDTGFSHFGCYGSTIETPNVDALAAGGLKYTGFHTTSLCSPTRACLLTGRNHHAVGMRSVSNFDTGYPNMRGAIPKTAATLPEILRENGYATFANAVGAPSISLPFPSAPPRHIGIQLTAAPGADARLLAWAWELEQALAG